MNIYPMTASKRSALSKKNKPIRKGGQFKEGEFMATEAALRAVAKYDKENTVRFGVKLNKKTDADVIEALKTAKEGKQGYIKRLIREDIAKQNKRQ